MNIAKTVLPLALATSFLVTVPAWADSKETSKPFDEVCELVQWDDNDMEMSEDWSDDIDLYEIAAQLLNMDDDALFEAMKDGKSLADVATENGVDPSVIVNEAVAPEKALLDELLASNEIDQDEYNELVGQISAEIEFEMNHVYVDPIQWLTATLGLDEDAFWTQMEEGKVINDIVVAQGHAPETVAQDLIAFLVSEDQKLVEAGIMSPEEAAVEQEVYTGLIPSLMTLSIDALDSVFDDEEEEWLDDDWAEECEDLADDTLDPSSQDTNQ